MNVKQFIQLFLPPIYYKAKKILCSKKKIELCPLPKIAHEEDRMVVIGNGPSLNKSIELYGGILRNTDCLMVNHSAATDVFDYIHPKYYLLVDPAWVNPDNSNHRDAICKTIENIIRKTTWPMTIILPLKAKEGYATSCFAQNPNLRVLFFEDGNVMHNNLSMMEAWDKNLIAPPGQTVLNAAVWLGIYWGYKETYLIGADTSFVADLHVDQETNIVYSIDTHFYSTKEVALDDFDIKNNRRTFGTKLHEEYFSAGTALKDYWDMKAYADWKGVKVYNASEYSWIDAFERKKLK
jgi:hypothetical protein